MRKLTILTAIAVFASLAGACNREDGAPSTRGGAIEFRALIDKKVDSRASLVDRLDDMSSFFVAAGLELPGADTLGFMQSAVWRTGPLGNYAWNYSPNKYYPADGTPVNFYAYAPIKDVNMGNDAELSINTANGEVWFDYAVPFDQSKSNTAVDLLVADVTGKVDDQTAVAFEFDHALSGVTFSAGNDNHENSELVYVINAIEISALYSEGRFIYPLSWDPTGQQDFYKAGIPESGVSVMYESAFTPVRLLSANDIMMVLPQQTNASGTIVDVDGDGIPDDLSSVSYVRIVFSVRDGSGAIIYENGERYLPLPGGFAFDPGTLYNFQFRFGRLNAVTFEVTKLNDWTYQDI